MGEVRIFSLSLYPDVEIKSFDYWVKNTVVLILSEFLKNDSNVVVYVCDSEDERENQRHKVFQYWYAKEFELHRFIAKYDFITTSKNGYTINSSLIYNRDNYLADFIIQQFKEVMEIH